MRFFLSDLGRHPRLYAWAALGGVLYALGFCGFDQWVLAWFCLVPTLWALADPAVDARRAACLGWTTGMLAHLGCYTWIVHMLRFFAYLPLPLAIPIYLLLCAAQSSLFAAWGASCWWLQRRAGVPLGLAAACCMVVAEWLYPAIFPSYLANSQYLQPLVLQGVELWGTLGLSFILVASHGAMAAVLGHLSGRCPLGRRGALGVAATLLLVLGNCAYGSQQLEAYADLLRQAPRKVRFGLVQTNMGIYEKSENPIEGLRRHREQSLQLEAAGAELVIWPESGYYFGIETGTPSVKDTVLGPLKTPVLFGGLRIERGHRGRRLYNSAFLADGKGTLLGSYDKTVLLAFGEYLPFGDWFPFLYDLSPQTLRLWRGEHVEPLAYDGIRYGILICYEDILPGFVRRVAAKNPDVLVNLTNDAWFGDSYEPRIHLALAAFRAVEHRRYLLRSTNTGISSIIEPTGRLVEQSGVFSRSNLLGEFVPLRHTTVYGRFGDWLGYLCGLWMLGWARRPLAQAAGAFRVRRAARRALS
jgi:apolipoprotein N-acyltransferase